MTTTATEFMIGRSLDDATDRKQETRKIGWALLAALVLHLVIGYLLVTFNGLFSSAMPMEDKPVELTIMDLSTPPPVVKKNPMFMEVDEKKQTVEQPKEKTFESNVNSIAASQLPGTGSAPLPSQQGTNRPSVDLETHEATLAMDGAQPRPSTPPQVTPSPSVAPSAQPTATPLPDEFAMLRTTPTPAARPTPTPQQARSIYQPMKQQTHMSGNISNRGIASVNAIGSPLGRYKKIVYDAIGSHWYAYMEERRDLANIGNLKVRFFVDRSGHIKNLKILENSSNEAFANICLQSILEAQLPPIPDEVADTLPSEGLEEDGLIFTIYPN